jgi:outer membrane protein assembly factor BamB
MKRFFYIFLVIIIIAGCSSSDSGSELNDDSGLFKDKSQSGDSIAKTEKPQFEYKPPYPNDSPWPCFRRDHRNTGASPVKANYNGLLPWSFKTGKGIFSTPVIDGDETVYFGSADKNFYAVNSGGFLKWRFECGELIDSAAALSPYDEKLGCPTVTVPSGDGFLYHLRADGIGETQDRVIWKYNATQDVTGGGKCNWWEANVVMGYDGTYYAGNTNWNYYAISPDGALKWVYPTKNIAWTAASFDDEGNIFWGSLDLAAHKVNPEGKNLWKKTTLMFVVSSMALGSDGTVYFGSFDNNVYALDPLTGKAKWSFTTDGHIYASPALGVDADGKTNAIFIASTDGILYALNPQGKLLWKYDAGDPIRSSPVIGKAPASENRDIVYFGCSDGRLYAVNADTGEKRWSFDTTTYDDPELRDRNDLNGSPALGKNGVYIGGEHGYLWFVPYDYPLSEKGKFDSRCSIGGGEAFDDDIKAVYFVTPGGSTETGGAGGELPAATTITSRLVVRKGGSTIDAGLYSLPLFDIYPLEKIIKISPEVDFTAELSADGHYIYINPEGFLSPSTEYTITFDGFYIAMGLHIGNIEIGGTKGGRIKDVIKFKTAESAASFPMTVGMDEVSAIEMRRLAVPFPAMMTSLNQIGFDSYHWIQGIIDRTEPDENGEGSFIVWSIGAVRNENGELVPDPATEFTYPLSGRFMNDFFTMENKGVVFDVSNVRIPFNLFQLRGQFGSDLSVRPGASVYAEVSPFSDPYYGPLLILGGLVNKNAKLVAGGTFMAEKYSGMANKRPDGVTVTALNYSKPALLKKGYVKAAINIEKGFSWNPDEHIPAIILVDADRLEALSFDYRKLLTYSKDSSGNLAGIRLDIPAGTKLPARLTAYVMLDVFPLLRMELR